MPFRNLPTTLQGTLRASETLFSLKQHADAMVDRVLAGRSPSRSFSQHREDLILVELLKGSLSTGFYVDVGANHPSKLSNTYRLYTHGMRGITVEPSRVFYDLHRRYRPLDLCICAGMGATEGAMWFLERRYHANSSFIDASESTPTSGNNVIRRTFVPVITLAGLLSTIRVGGRTEFSLLSIDCEGYDLEVLRGNDWAKFRPSYVIVEFISTEVQGTLVAFLEGVGYKLMRLVGCNMLFCPA